MPYDLKSLITLSRIILGTLIAKICQLGSVPFGTCGKIILDESFFNFFKKYCAFFLRNRVISSSFLICSSAIADKISESIKLLPTFTQEYFLRSPLMKEDLFVPFSLIISAVLKRLLSFVTKAPPSPLAAFLVP